MLAVRSTVVLTLAYTAGGAHGSEVSIPNQVAAPGSFLSIPITLRSQSDPISGLQFDVEYDESVMSVVLMPGAGLRRANKTLQVADRATGIKRILIFGQNRDLIPEGIALSLTVSLRGSAANAEYPLRFIEVIGVNGEGAQVLVTASNGNVSVKGSLSEAVPLQPTGVLSGASLVTGAVAPGEILTLLGSGIGPESAAQPRNAATSIELANTSVWFDQVQAQLLYAGPNQINLIAPYAIAGRSFTRLQVRTSDQARATMDIPVAPTVPGIFTLSSNGIGPGAILNEDYSVNQPGNAADRGSVISFYATGAGQTDPAGVDGQIAGDPLPKPVGSVSVRIGGLDAVVLYAGAAPGLVAGVLQVNCRVPLGATTGPAVPLELQVGDAVSPAGVTIAIQ